MALTATEWKKEDENLPSNYKRVGQIKKWADIEKAKADLSGLFFVAFSNDDEIYTDENAGAIPQSITAQTPLYNKYVIHRRANTSAKKKAADLLQTFEKTRPTVWVLNNPYPWHTKQVLPFELKQPRQKTPESFIPSDRLSAYLVDAMQEQHLEDMLRLEKYTETADTANTDIQSAIDRIRRDLNDFEADFGLDNARVYLSNAIYGLFSTIALGEQRIHSQIYFLTRNNIFNKHVRAAIFERLQISEYDLGSFLQDLESELRKTAHAETFGGKWGYLAIRNNELALIVNKKSQRKSKRAIENMPVT